MAKLAKLLLILAALAWAGGAPLPGLPVVASPAIAAEEPAPGEHADTDGDGDHDAADHAEGEAHADGHTPHGVVEVNIAMLIWQIILFVVFFAVLAKFVWPHILKGLKGREEKIRSDLASAENAAKEATTTLEEYKQQLAEAQQEARRVIDEARQTASGVEAKLIADAEQKAAELRERNVAEIAAAKDQALGEIHSQAAELSTMIASKILKREINAQDQQQLVDESLAELAASNN